MKCGVEEISFVPFEVSPWDLSDDLSFAEIL